MAGLAVLLYASFSVGPIRHYHLRTETNWRVIAEYLSDNARPGDIVLVEGDNYRQNGVAPWFRRYLSYYMSRYGMNQTPMLRANRGLGEDLQTMGESRGEVWFVLRQIDLPASWKGPAEVTVAHLDPKVAIIRLNEPTGDLVQDTASMLELMLDPFPGEARFDVHLALAEISAQRGDLSEAASHLTLAALNMPNRQKAASDLAEVSNLLAPLLGLHFGQVAFGDYFALRGYHLEPTTVEPGQSIAITLWLKTLGEIEEDYTLFIHLADSEGRVWAQEDRLLEHDGLFTSAWETGQVATQQHQLMVPADAPAGEYVVQAGVYYWQTEERLPVWDENRQQLPEDTILLDPICISD